MAEIKEGENRYILGKAESGEWHIYRASQTAEGCTIMTDDAICGDAKYSEAEEKEGTWKNEQRMRERCLKIGRPICGKCLSHLYKTITEEEQAILNS